MSVESLDISHAWFTILLHLFQEVGLMADKGQRLYEIYLSNDIFERAKFVLFTRRQNKGH